VTEGIRITVAAAEEKQADDIIVLDMSETFPITDYFVIMSAGNPRKLKSIARNIEDKLAKEAKLKPYLREGTEETGWMLLDYIDFIIHIFGTEERDFYRLEQLWQDAPRVALTSP
jgi:ribosome-associated protein